MNENNGQLPSGVSNFKNILPISLSADGIVLLIFEENRWFYYWAEKRVMQEIPRSEVSKLVKPSPINSLIELLTRDMKADLQKPDQSPIIKEQLKLN